MAFKVIVEGFPQDGTIPARFTCEGENTPPPLAWEGEPADTKSFALIVDDPDASGGAWNHWLLWDIPASTHALPVYEYERIKATRGTNDFGRLDYGGPCPPRGRPSHRYYFRLFAVDTPALGLPEGTKRRAFEKALQKHAIAEAAYMGRYQRH